MATFGERLKYLRENSNMSQADFADVVKVNRMTINNYETGKRYPDLKFAMDVSEYFGVTMDYLCGKSEYRSSEKYKAVTKSAEEFVEIIENSFDKEAETLLNKLKYLLMLAGDDNITTELLVCINAILMALEEIVLAYRKANKHIDNEDITGHKKEIPYYINTFAMAECEKVLSTNSVAKTEICKVLDENYERLKKRLMEIK